jgi:hypothetical protein
MQEHRQWAFICAGKVRAGLINAACLLLHSIEDIERQEQQDIEKSLSSLQRASQLGGISGSHSLHTMMSTDDLCGKKAIVILTR